jgi:hypothetical protein
MKKLFALTFILAFIVGVAVSPLWAAGDKNHGDVGSGQVEQGGAGFGSSPGDNAEGYQAD